MIAENIGSLMPVESADQVYLSWARRLLRGSTFRETALSKLFVRQ